MTTDQHTLTCSQVSADSLWPLNGLGFGQSAFPKSMNTPSKSSGDTGRSPSSSGTCETSHSERLAALTSLQEDFRVSLFQLPGIGVEIPTRAFSGPNASEYCAKYDPASHSLRTSQVCLRLTGDEPLTESLATFPRSGMIVSGIAFQLPPLVAFTNGTASGLSPLLPTPTACDHKGSGRLRLERGANNNLRDWFKINYGFLYPPVRLVEWLMGYPIDHTDSGEREMPSCRMSRSKSSKRSTIKSNAAQNNTTPADPNLDS
jgi:hypothetical protein